MKLGVPKEITPGESRVALTPKTAKRFQQQGFSVFVEKGAGVTSQITDQDYQAAGAVVIGSKKELWEQCDLILKVLPPTSEEVKLYRRGQFGASYFFPAENQELLKALSAQGCSYLSMDSIPRISRAQKMDVLSSMANIAGYRAVIEGSHHFGRFLNGQITAAGKVDPAKVLVIGAGVAGLAAIGSAKNLGAIVRAFDTRKVVAEQIQSMGAQFLTVEIEEDGSTSSGYSKEMSPAFVAAEMALFKKQAAECDIVICTALIPGRPAPKLWLKEAVESMKPGSVIVDLAYSRGGNCELTEPGKVIQTSNGVTIVGILDQMPQQASQLYSSNLAHLLDDMGKAAKFNINLQDDVIKGSLVLNSGEVRWPLPQISVAATPSKESKKVEVKEAHKPKEKNFWTQTLLPMALLGGLLFFVGQNAPEKFMGHFTVFVLSIFIGWQVIWNVTHALHTPLMSVTNAISGIILIGGLLNINSELGLPTLLAFIAILVASINIVGGFVVTHRMLKMFQRS
jgi:NAD(P) transhydrogenase subunit alpha